MHSAQISSSTSLSSSSNIVCNRSQVRFVRKLVSVPPCVASLHRVCSLLYTSASSPAPPAWTVTAIYALLLWCVLFVCMRECVARVCVLIICKALLRLIAWNPHRERPCLVCGNTHVSDISSGRRMSVPGFQSHIRTHTHTNTPTNGKCQTTNMAQTWMSLFFTETTDTFLGVRLKT